MEQQRRNGVKPAENQQMKCPRCDSTNTKFCYYNNYSLSQPRYFCKACRRYWTHGGTLRNVPVGGGCRKAKRPKPSPLPIPPSQFPPPPHPIYSHGASFLSSLAAMQSLPQFPDHYFPPPPSSTNPNHWQDTNINQPFHPSSSH